MNINLVLDWEKGSPNERQSPEIFMSMIMCRHAVVDIKQTTYNHEIFIADVQ